jgi:3-phenylpropionate/trans-cinnamate dioxygenase ferredoxin reductase component
MADRHVDVLLCGGGLASANCAKKLRDEGYEGSVLLVGREPDPPYSRPYASKDYLRGESERSDAYSLAPEWYEENSVELLTKTSVLKLDLEDRVAVLSSQEEVSFDKALIATGANVRLLRVDGVQLEGIHYLRALGNADTIRADVEDASNVVVVGGSYIATEVAASLTVLGKQVTMLMQEHVVHERSFGGEAGRFFQDVLEKHGVTIHGDDGLARFEEGPSGRVGRVVSENGLELDADSVVIGAGAIPDTMLAKQAGLEIGERGGVVCSSRLETAVPGVFCAGDMCEYDSVVHGGPVRIEHWDVAFNQGKHAALGMMGSEEDYSVVPYFFSDLADWASLEYVGPAYEWDREVVKGSIPDGTFSVFYLEGSRVRGCLAVGRSDDLERATELIKSGEDVDPDSL